LAKIGLYIYSQYPSCRKTTTLWYALKNLLEGRQLCSNYLFVKMGVLIEKLRDFDSAQEFLHKLKTCELLVIDNFGREKTTDFVDTCVFEILDYRSDKGLPVIIASHLSLRNNDLWIKDIDQSIRTRIVRDCQLVDTWEGLPPPDIAESIVV